MNYMHLKKVKLSFLVIIISLMTVSCITWSLFQFMSWKKQEQMKAQEEIFDKWCEIKENEYRGIIPVRSEYVAPYNEYIKNNKQLPQEAFEKNEVGLIYLGTVKSTRQNKVFDSFSSFQKNIDRTTLTDWIFANSISGKYEAEEFYGIQVPIIDFRTQGYVFSLGRKINKLTYEEATCYREYDIDYLPLDMRNNGISHQPVGIPTMSKQYYPSTVFIYWYEKDTLEPDYLLPSWYYDTLFIVGE